MRIRLLTPSEYQPEAAAAFAVIARRLMGVLPSIQVEHVGASAVPGAISRGDLDILVLVDAASFDVTHAAIKRLGFAEKPGTLRTAGLCMLVPTAEQEDVAVQLVAKGSEFEFFLTFRDALRARRDLVVEYNELKERAASLGEDGYREAKNGFIRRVLAQAS
ncbi:MAG TPA: GrpB family protein [Ramlibacter sp.]